MNFPARTSVTLCEGVTPSIREDDMSITPEPVDQPEDMDSTLNEPNDPITPVKGFKPVPPPKSPGFIKKALMEENGETPSSARLIAAFILGALTVLTFLIILVLLFRIMTIQDPMLGASLLSSLTKITLYWFLFFAATALSLYGINVWKYIAGMRMGFDTSLDGGMGGSGNTYGSPYGGPSRFGAGATAPYGSSTPLGAPKPVSPATPAAARYRRTAAGGPATLTKDDPLPSKTDDEA